MPRVIPTCSRSYVSSSKTVCILHPGYSRYKTLLQIESAPTEDDPDGPSAIHHQTVLDACRIIAQNRDGFLSAARELSGRVALDTVWLTGANYWYFLHDAAQDERYPIVDDFLAWPFPEDVPAHWAAAHQYERPRYCPSASGMSAAVKADDKECIVSKLRTSHRNMSSAMFLTQS